MLSNEKKNSIYYSAVLKTDQIFDGYLLFDNDFLNLIFLEIEHIEQ